MYEEDEVREYYDPEPPEENEGEEDYGRGAGGPDDPDQVVVSGDPSAAANQLGGAAGLKSHKDKKIPNDQRSTTPYMTKYEKARILGTRALQIRWVCSSS